jgi:hypothetical protein
VDIRRTSTLAAGAVALAAGSYQALTGLRGTPGRQPEGALDPWLRDLDSEVRYYASWYAAAGATTLVRGLRNQPVSGVPWLVAGAARLRGARTERPGPAYLGLGLLEVAVGAVLLRPRRRQLSGPDGAATT